MGGARTRSPSQRLVDAGWDVLDAAMLDGPPQDMVLTSAEQVRVLTHELRLRLLTALAERPGSAKDLADRFGVPTTRLYHHLSLLEEHGFVEVVATRRSGARTERCYGMPPRRSVRPGPELMAASDRDVLAEAVAALVEVTAVSLAAAIRAGRVDLAAPEDEQRTLVSSLSARLTPAQQRAFVEELTALVGRVTEASAANREARGGDTEGRDEAVQLLLVLAPDVTQPD